MFRPPTLSPATLVADALEAERRASGRSAPAADAMPVTVAGLAMFVEPRWHETSCDPGGLGYCTCGLGRRIREIEDAASTMLPTETQRGPA